MSRNICEGPARSAIQIIRAMQEGPLQPVPVFSNANEDMGTIQSLIEGAQPRWIDLERPSYSMKPAEFPRFFLNTMKAVKTLSGIIRSEDIRLVHANSIISLQAVLAARRCKVPCVVFVREIMPNKRLNTAYIKWICRNATAVVGVSEAVKRRLVRAGADKEKIFVINNGTGIFDTSEDEKSAIRKELGIPEGVPVVGTIGTIVESKGQHILVRAISSIKDKFPGLRLVVVGKTVPEPGSEAFLKKLHKYVAEHGMSETVIFAGGRNDIPKVMAMFDLCVQPSLFQDPLPRTVIEAMAAGVPVIGSDAGGIPEMIVHGQTGLIVKPQETEALAEALTELLSSPDEIKRMGAAALERTTVFFNEKTQVEKVKQLYLRILSK